MSRNTGLWLAEDLLTFRFFRWKRQHFWIHFNKTLSPIECSHVWSVNDKSDRRRECSYTLLCHQGRRILASDWSPRGQHSQDPLNIVHTPQENNKVFTGIAGGLSYFVPEHWIWELWFLKTLCIIRVWSCQISGSNCSPLIYAGGVFSVLVRSLEVTTSLNIDQEKEVKTLDVHKLSKKPHI